MRHEKKEEGRTCGCDTAFIYLWQLRDFRRPAASLNGEIASHAARCACETVIGADDNSSVHVFHRLDSLLRSVTAFSPDTLVVGVSRLGHSSQDIVYCSLRAMAAGPPLVDLGEPLHSLIIPGTVTEMEEQALRALARSVDEMASVGPPGDSSR